MLAECKVTISEAEETHFQRVMLVGLPGQDWIQKSTDQFAQTDNLEIRTGVPCNLWDTILSHLDRLHKTTCGTPHKLSPIEEVELYQYIRTHQELSLTKIAEIRGLSRDILINCRDLMHQIIHYTLCAEGAPLPDYLQDLKLNPITLKRLTEEPNHVLSEPTVQKTLEDIPHVHALFSSFATHHTSAPFLQSHNVPVKPVDIPRYDGYIREYFFSDREMGIYDLTKRILFSHWVNHHTHWGNHNSEKARLDFEEAIALVLDQERGNEDGHYDIHKAYQMRSFLALMLRLDFESLRRLPWEERRVIWAKEYVPKNRRGISCFDDVNAIRTLQRMVTVNGKMPRALDWYLTLQASGEVDDIEIARKIAESLNYSTKTVQKWLSSGNQLLMNMILYDGKLAMSWNDLTTDQLGQLTSTRKVIRKLLKPSA